MGPKKPYLISVTLGLWVLISAANLGVFVASLPSSFGGAAKLASFFLYACYISFWLWSLNLFAHYLVSFFPRWIWPQPGPPQPEARVAILYTTCDDFDPEACETCLQQTHPHTRLIICDDSHDPAMRAAIDQWVAAHPGARITVVRRPERRGYKAGNLNYAIAHFAPEEYLLLCDADECLPPDFVERLLPYFFDERVGFVQANHRARTRPRTHFAATLALGIDVFYAHYLPAKNRFGYVPCLGHGVIIRRSVWEAIGGFPEIICEDAGFAARALRHGYRGVFVPQVIAEEAAPSTFRAFLKSRSRIVTGQIEFLQTEYPALLRARDITWTEKLDLLANESAAYMGLAVCLSLWGSLLLSYAQAQQGVNGNPCWLPFAYALGPIFAVGPVLYKLLLQPKRYGRHLFIMAALYTSSMPIVALEAIAQTFRLRRPVFHVTGKIGRERQQGRDFAPLVAFGLALIIASRLIPSPMSPITDCLALTFLLTPLLRFTEESGPLGLIARYCGWAPYLAMIGLGLWMTFASTAFGLGKP